METLIDVKQLLSGESDRLEFELTVPPEAMGRFPDVTFSQPFTLRGKITNRAGYMHLTLDTTIPYETFCARCLTPLSISYPLHLDKTVAEASALEDADSDEVVSDYILTENGKFDVVGAVAEQMMLELPLRHLCRSDCQGLCSLCGHNKNEGDCGCRREIVNPQFAALRDQWNRDK